MTLVRYKYWHILFIAVVLLGLAGCKPQSDSELGKATTELQAVELHSGERLRVVATTSIVADIVAQVGGDDIAMQTLLPVGTDPHSFDPSPRDIAAIADGHVLFVNGAGLEEFLERLLDSVGGDIAVVALSDGVALRTLGPDAADHDAHTHHEGVDPHTWTDPRNGIVFVRNVERALSALDPAHADAYAARAQAYSVTLKETDAWIAQMIANIPPDRRLLVTDHLVFGYFAERYGLQQVGAVIPGFSTGASPSAREMAQLQDTVQTLGVPAVFASATVNPDVAARLADDTGVRFAMLYTGSLGSPGSGADTYVGYLRYNTRTIVEALR